MEAALTQLSMHHAELALRMVVGVVPGGLIGWERTVEDRHFGVRIHMLTSLDAAVAILYGLRRKPKESES